MDAIHTTNNDGSENYDTFYVKNPFFTLLYFTENMDNFEALAEQVNFGLFPVKF